MTTTIKYTLTLTILSLILFLPGINKIPMIDRDSAHFAQATKQMVETGEYFQIRFQDKTRFQKPPGINWLQAFSVNTFNDANSVWPYRIPSALGGLLAVLALFFFARRMTGEKTAFVASCVLACSLLLVVESHLIVIDASLLATVVVMQGSLWLMYQRWRSEQTLSHPIWPTCFWLMMSWGICLKGVTPLVGFGSILALSIMDKDYKWLRSLRFHWGIPLLLLSSAWLLLVNQAENSNYLWQIFQKDLLPKLQGGHESHGAPPGYHTALLPLTFWPGSLFLWIGLVTAWRLRTQPWVKFLIAWVLPTWLFFELMPSKLPQYMLPTFPALALLVGYAIHHFAVQPLQGKHKRLLQIMYIGWLVLSLALAAVFIWIPYYVDQQVNLVSLISAVAILSMLIVAIPAVWRLQYRTAWIATVLAAVITYPVVYQGLLPQLQHVWLTENIAEQVHRLAPDFDKNQQIVASIGYGEPSLVFKLGTHKVRYSDPENLLSLAKQHPDLIVVVDSRRLPEVVTMLKHEKMAYRQENQIRGFNYSKGDWVDVMLLRLHS